MMEPQENSASPKTSRNRSVAENSPSDSQGSNPSDANTASKVTSNRTRSRKTPAAADASTPDDASARSRAAAVRSVSVAKRKTIAEQTELNLDTDAWRPGSGKSAKDMDKPAPKEKAAPRSRAKAPAERSDDNQDRQAPARQPRQNEGGPQNDSPKPRAPRKAAPPRNQEDAGGRNDDRDRDRSTARKPRPKLDMDAQRMAEIEAKAREAEARAREAEARAKEAEARAREAELKAGQRMGGGGGNNRNQRDYQDRRGSGDSRDNRDGRDNRENRGGGGGNPQRGQPQNSQSFQNRNRPNKQKNRNKKKRGRGRDDYPQQKPQYQGSQSSSGESQPDYSNEEVPDFILGIVEISGKGFGFLRDPKKNFTQTPNDVFVTPELISKYQLRDGQMLYGETRKGARGPQLAKLLKINDEDPAKYQSLPNFDELTVLNPMERLTLETEPGRHTTRILDLITPIGKGQRGLIVSPPRSGKTTLLQHIAEAITINHPSMPLIFLLIDERPEEVTELRRAFPNADVMASSNDNDVKTHTRIAQLAIERAKRLVEAGHDVFMLLDSITRMARAFNNASTGGGKTGSGGVDLKAMEIPRRIFASARNTEEAGSLTIIASALIDTGSRMDEYIFQEFKGTGNMDVYLDRRISDQLVFPAIDIFQSGTRREELILPPYMLEKISTIRRGLAGAKPMEAIQRLIMLTDRFDTNFDLLNQIKLNGA